LERGSVKIRGKRRKAGIKRGVGAYSEGKVCEGMSRDQWFVRKKNIWEVGQKSTERGKKKKKRPKISLGG